MARDLIEELFPRVRSVRKLLSARVSAPPTELAEALKHAKSYRPPPGPTSGLWSGYSRVAMQDFWEREYIAALDILASAGPTSDIKTILQLERAAAVVRDAIARMKVPDSVPAVAAGQVMAWAEKHIGIRFSKNLETEDLDDAAEEVERMERMRGILFGLEKKYRRART